MEASGREHGASKHRYEPMNHPVPVMGRAVPSATSALMLSGPCRHQQGPHRGGLAGTKTASGFCPPKETAAAVREEDRDGGTRPQGCKELLCRPQGSIALKV